MKKTFKILGWVKNKMMVSATPLNGIPLSVNMVKILQKLNLTPSMIAIR